MHSEYSVDVGDRALMQSRSWRWLKARIEGLLSADTRLLRAVAPPPDQS